MKHDAIVLLGYSGVGKDTAFAELNNRRRGKYTNVKFGLLAKTLVANILGIQVQQLEDRQLRESKVIYGLSPNEILTVLFRGCTPALTEAHLSYAFDNLDDDKLPVFTDVRRWNEAEAINERYSNPLYFLLWCNQVECGDNDYLIQEIAVVNNAKPIFRDSITSVTDVVNAIDKEIDKMEFSAYAKELLMLQYELLQPAYHAVYFSTLSHGLTEELLELYEVVDNDGSEQERISELGDVFAYATLLVISMEMANDMHKASVTPLESILELTVSYFINALGSPIRSSLTELALDSAGSFKRHFRGEEGYVSPDVIAEIAVGALRTQDDLDLGEVLKFNIDKLTDRKNRGLMAKGKGNNR